MPRKDKKYHKLEDSPFFRLRSRAKLASLLFVGHNKLQELCRQEDLYFQFKKHKTSGGFRQISAPRNDLKAVQSRIADLLQRISPPDYLFAPVSGRSYVDNAAVHLGANSVRLLDIEDFFPSCTGNRIIWFFRKKMQCSPDVAKLVKTISTREESLPQGSPCSPILAYLCYVDMWEEISRIVDNAGCVLSVYADDLTISGKTVPEKTIWEIKVSLRKYGHHYQASKERSKHMKPAEVTGVILKRNELHAPNRLYKKLHDIRYQFKKSRSQEQKTDLAVKIRGREAQLAQVRAGNLSSGGL